MKIVEQGWNFCGVFVSGEEALRVIELAGRTCYKSKSDITKETSEEFAKKIIANGHESVLEHVTLSVRIVTDRGVTHELVRHRLGSYSQESTRYCNYGKTEEGVSFIRPVWCYVDNSAYIEWNQACLDSEAHYLALLNLGWSPQHARTVLNNSLKTEVVVTFNIREWRHFFRLRTAPAAHPQMRALARDMFERFKSWHPVLFDDIKIPKEVSQ